MNKIATGFSLVELMVVVGIIGILVALALPRYRAFAVRGYRAEARVNLGHIATLQGIYRSLHNKYASMPTIGYVGGGSTNCADIYFDAAFNALSFQPPECENLHYGYTVTGDATQFTAVAYAPSDAGERWIYGGCDGAGAVEYGKSQGDLLVATHALDTRVCRNIIKYCPDPTAGGSNTSTCGTTQPPPCRSSCAAACGAWTYNSWGSWSPSTNSRCAGTNFTQTRQRLGQRICPYNLCGGTSCPLHDTDSNSRSATGTRYCPPPPPPPPPPTPTPPPVVTPTPPPVVGGLPPTCSCSSCMRDNESRYIYPTPRDCYVRCFAIASRPGYVSKWVTCEYGSLSWQCRCRSSLSCYVSLMNNQVSEVPASSCSPGTI